jgi:hypothetical protein
MRLMIEVPIWRCVRRIEQVGYPYRRDVSVAGEHVQGFVMRIWKSGNVFRVEDAVVICKSGT